MARSVLFSPTPVEILQKVFSGVATKISASGTEYQQRILFELKDTNTAMTDLFLVYYAKRQPGTARMGGWSPPVI